MTERTICLVCLLFSAGCHVDGILVFIYVIADAEVARQPRYPAFAEQINKALAGFERAREWADLITCLQKLSKALGRSAPPFVTVPSRLLLGRRLAQCLNAALPSGVHLEALETYELLFHRIGVR